MDSTWSQAASGHRGARWVAIGGGTVPQQRDLIQLSTQGPISRQTQIPVEPALQPDRDGPPNLKTVGIV